MLIHGGLSKKESIILTIIAIITAPIWIPYVLIRKLIKKIKGN